jgi:hypothetical protein
MGSHTAPRDSELDLPAAREEWGRVVDAMADLTDRFERENRDPRPDEASEFRRLSSRAETLRSRVDYRRRGDADSRAHPTRSNSTIQSPNRRAWA